MTYVDVPIGYIAADFCNKIPRTIGESQTCGDLCQWKYYHSNTTLLIWGSGSMSASFTSNTMPWYLQQLWMTNAEIYDVNSVGSYSFYNFNKLTTVLLGSTITSIGSYSFDNCTILKSITLPKQLTTID